MTPPNLVLNRYSFEGPLLVPDLRLSVNSKKIFGLISMVIPAEIKMIERIKYIFNPSHNYLFINDFIVWYFTS